MKKALFVIAFCLFSIFSYSQLLSKKGIPILPEPKEFSIGVDAIPFLEFAGGLFNDDNDAPRFQFPYVDSLLTITGKYVITENKAYRAAVRLGFSNEKNTSYVYDVTSPLVQVADERTMSEANVALSAGMEFWRGKGRVRGLYGYEGAIALMTRKSEYSYGNKLTQNNQTHTTTFGQEEGLKEDKYPAAIGVGVRGFVGVQYFLAPKISVSGEFGWGPMIVVSGTGERVYEEWDPTANNNLGGSKSVTVKSGKASGFSLDNDNALGALVLNVYF